MAEVEPGGGLDPGAGVEAGVGAGLATGAALFPGAALAVATGAAFMLGWACTATGAVSPTRDTMENEPNTVRRKLCPVTGNPVVQFRREEAAGVPLSLLMPCSSATINRDIITIVAFPNLNRVMQRAE